MAEPLIVLRGVCRAYPSGDGIFLAVRDIDLTIDAGEMVAIVGASGSGKSTLMNILGCLDRPTAGSYRVMGAETSALEPDELAALRREHFGFIFQRYHLLTELSALENVELPATYAGCPVKTRRFRALGLLKRLGMTDRAGHRPNQLSGGQQQRVSIARALVNGGDILFADEPTGALDTHSGDEVLKILGELHAEGKTVVIVTHDPAIAARADRIIEIADGVIVSDRRKAVSTASFADSVRSRRNDAGGLRAAAGRLGEAFTMAFRSMAARRLRTFLAMLGIIIGIASVVCVVALGEGSRQRVLSDIGSLGTNTLEIFPGRDFGDIRSGRVTTLVVADANALATQPYVAAVTPTVSTPATIRFGAKESNALVNGVGERYFVAKGTKTLAGSVFDSAAVAGLAQVVVIDQNTRDAFFGADGDALGKVVLIGKVPCRIIGVVKPQQGGFGSSQMLSIYLPYTTVQTRFLGSSSLRSITVRVDDGTDSALAEQTVERFLTQRHGAKDFTILNTDDIRQTITSATRTMTELIAAIAVISLLVGGIGVMNIMLVSVSERINEIGVRMAVGARRGDILQQFLTEAVMICMVGGILGIVVALAAGSAFNSVTTNFALVYSGASVVAAVLCSTLTGVLFGYMPARNASRLDPVAALSRD